MRRRWRARASGTRLVSIGNPAASPLLGDIGGRAAAARRIENKIAGIGGHQHAARNDLGVRLNNIRFGIRKAPICVSVQTLVGP